MGSLPVIGRARTNMRINAFSYGRLFIQPAIHVAIIEPDLSNTNEAVEVLLNVSRSGGGAAALIGQRVLIGILRRITPQQTIQAQCTVTRVLIPHTIIRPTTSHRLKNLVRSSLRPTRACQRNLTRHNRSRNRRPLHILNGARLIVASLHRTTNTRGDDSLTPRRITRQLTTGINRRHTHSPRPPAIGRVILILRIITHRPHNNDTAGHRPSNRPVQELNIMVLLRPRNRDNLRPIIHRHLDSSKSTAFNAKTILLTRLRLLVVDRSSRISDKSSVRCYAVVFGHQHRRNSSGMSLRTFSRLILTRSLHRNIGPRQLRSTRINRPIDHRDGHALTCVPLRTRLIQLVIREIFLGRNRIISVRGPRRHRQRTHAQRESTGGGSENARRLVSGYHWRRSHPSSSRLTGAIVRSVP